MFLIFVVFKLLTFQSATETNEPNLDWSVSCMNGALSVDYKLKMAGMPNNDFWLDEIKIFRNYMTDGIVL
jgi:hypothetical protein